MKSVPYSFLAFLGVAGLLAGCGGPEPGKGEFRPVPISTMASGSTHERPIVQEPVAAIVTAARAQIGKTVRYDSAYVGLAYPGGDVPIERGVCTDVVIRALRDALKMDLQKLVHEDMRSSFSAYPELWGLKRPDRNIDHRRVPNLRRYFERQGYQLDVTARKEDYLPGDVVTCTVGGNRPHIMIVSDRTAADGTPLVIHNIGSGAKEENRLFAFPVTGHYRMTQARSPVGASPQPSAAAATYHKYQRCGMTGARRLFCSSRF